MRVRDGPLPVNLCFAQRRPAILAARGPFRLPATPPKSPIMSQPSSGGALMVAFPLEDVQRETALLDHATQAADRLLYLALLGAPI